MTINKHLARIALLFGFIVLMIAFMIMLSQTVGNRKSANQSFDLTATPTQTDIGG